VTALEFFYENNKKPALPYIAVAVQNTILLYYKYKKYFLFTVPEIEVSPEEGEIWAGFDAKSLELDEGIARLNQL
jgi:hypothetical protein